MNTSPVVAHVHFKYLAISETFIHRYIAGLQQFCPVVITEQILNKDKFNPNYRIHQVKNTDRVFYRAFAKTIRMSFPNIQSYWSRHTAYSHFVVKYRVKLLHAHYGDTGWFCIPLKKLHRLPLVVSFHGVDASALPRLPGWQLRLQELFDNADCVTTPSRFMAKQLEHLGCTPSKLMILRYGLDLDEWSYEQENIHKKSSSHRLLMVARLVEKKGIPYAIEAVSEMRERFPKVDLQIVGDGPLMNELKRLITHLNLSDHIKLLGEKSNEEVIKLMKQSHVLLAPSVTGANGDQEGLPNVLIEAAAIGLPVVGTLHTGIPEIVKDGVSGFLVPERDSVALTNRLILLLENEELRKQMGKAARDIVEQGFNRIVLVKQLEDLYYELL